MWFGIVMGLLASASWAGANVFVQKASRRVGPIRALIWAQIAGVLASAPVVLVFERGARQPIDSHTVAWAATAAVAAVVAYPCLFYSTERGRLSVVVPIMSSWSVVAAAISLGLLGERVRGAHLAGASLVMLGVLIVSRVSAAPKTVAAAPGLASTSASAPASASAAGAAGTSSRTLSRPTLLAALGGAIGFGVLIPSIERLAPATGRLGAVPVVFLMDLTLAVPLAAWAGLDLRPPSRAAWPVVLAAGFFETLGFVWISLGVSRAPVSVVSPLAGLASAFTVLFAWLVLGERPPLPALIGAGLACAGVVTLSL